MFAVLSTPNWAQGIAEDSERVIHARKLLQSTVLSMRSYEKLQIHGSVVAYMMLMAPRGRCAKKRAEKEEW